MREWIPWVNSNWIETEAGQWELCSETLIGAVRLKCQVGAEEMCEHPPREGGTSHPGSSAWAFAPSHFVCSLFSNRHLKGGQEDIKVAVLFIFFSPFVNYLLSFQLTLQFQRFNDTIVSENDTETDTHCHLIGCQDKMESAVL